jgi:hypothetical protein
MSPAHSGAAARRSLSNGRRSFVMALIVIAALAILGRPAPADSTETVTLTPPGLSANYTFGLDGSTVQSYVDSSGDTQPAGTIFFSGPITVTPGEMPAQIASDMAKALKAANPVSQQGAGSAGAVATFSSNDYGFVSVVANTKFPPNLAIASATTNINQPIGIQFNPDPGTGQSTLTSDGSFSLVDGGGLNLSYTEVSGTSAFQLASDLTAQINAAGPGYDAVANGDLVTFNDSAAPAGSVSFTATAGGIDYAILAIPEPASLFLLGTGFLGLTCWLRMRRDKTSNGPRFPAAAAGE